MPSYQCTGASMSDIWKQETLSSSDLELAVLPGIGGRLWDVRFQGHSLLFQNPDLMGYTPDPNELTGYPTKSPQFGFPLWGGEKTWIAPDTSWPNGAPYKALDSGSYETIETGKNHIAMRSPICPQSGLQIEREIRLESCVEFSIHHKVCNQGKDAWDVGIWSVMMLNHKARIGVPGKKMKTGDVFGNPAGFYSQSDEGIIWNCDEPGEFKMGTENPSGRTFVRFETDQATIWMLCQTDLAPSDDAFAHTFPLGIFNSGDYPYCEAEWHGPLKMLSPNSMTEFTQRFKVWADDAPLALAKTEMELMKCMS